MIAYYRLGLVHAALPHPWQAAARFRESVLLDPTIPEPHKAFGDLFLAQRRPLFDQAIEAYSKAIELRPFYADAHVGLGDARAAKGDVDGAIAAYQTALTFDPFNPRTHARLGKILADQGRCADSVSEYKRATELDPRTAAPPAARCER